MIEYQEPDDPLEIAEFELGGMERYRVLPVARDHRQILWHYWVTTAILLAALAAVSTYVWRMSLP